MYPRTRYTRSQSRSNSQSKGVRHTAKRNQSGGAVASSLQEFTFSNGSTRLSEWLGWQAKSGESLPYFGENGKISFDQFLRSIQQQDELYDGALQLIRTKLGFTDATTEQEIIQAYTANVDENYTTWGSYVADYMNDILQLLTLDTTRAFKKEGLPFLLQPNTTNVFIQSLANIFFLMKTDTAIDSIRGISDETVRSMLESQLENKYKSYSKGFALSTTQKDLDGYFYPGQYSGFKKDEITFGSIFQDSSFWSRFVANVVNADAIDYAVDNKQEQWADLAADIYLQYKDSSVPNFLESFLGTIVQGGARDRDSTTKSSKNRPTWSVALESTFRQFGSSNIPGTAVSLQAVVGKISFERLLFLLHLIYTLEQTKVAWEKQQALLATLETSTT